MPRSKVRPIGSRAQHLANKSPTPPTQPPSPPTERAARVRKLQTLTQSEYNQLFYITKAIVPPQLCDPNDALGHGLLIALQKYEGKGPLTAYVPRCAYLYALQQAKKRRHQVNFCDLQSDAEFDDYLDGVLPFLDDP